MLEIVNEYDSFRYTQHGINYEGFVKNVGKDFIEGRFCETDEYGQKMGVMFNTIIYLKDFKDLNMEWWFDGQGCDNSAIGVSGCWEAFV